MGEGRDLFGLKKNGDKLPLEISLNHMIIGDDFFVMAQALPNVKGTANANAQGQATISIETTTFTVLLASIEIQIAAATIEIASTPQVKYLLNRVFSLEQPLSSCSKAD